MRQDLDPASKHRRASIYRRRVPASTKFCGPIAKTFHIWYAVFAVIAPAAMAGATLGARQTGRMSPTALKRLMGVVMVVVALPLFRVAFTQP